MGCIKEYVSHWVSLWKGRIDSQDDDPDCGMALQGQASPRETPFMAVREGGQIGPRPFMRMFHRTGSGTMRMDCACVDGCDRRWSAR